MGNQGEDTRGALHLRVLSFLARLERASDRWAVFVGGGRRRGTLRLRRIQEPGEEMIETQGETASKD